MLYVFVLLLETLNFFSTKITTLSMSVWDVAENTFTHVGINTIIEADECIAVHKNLSNFIILTRVSLLYMGECFNIIWGRYLYHQYF